MCCTTVNTFNPETKQYFRFLTLSNSLKTCHSVWCFATLPRTVLMNETVHQGIFFFLYIHLSDTGLIFEDRITSFFHCLKPNTLSLCWGYFHAYIIRNYACQCSLHLIWSSIFFLSPFLSYAVHTLLIPTFHNPFKFVFCASNIQRKIFMIRMVIS